MKNLIILLMLLMTVSSHAHSILGKHSTHHAHYLWHAHGHSVLIGKVTESATGEPILFGDVALYKDGILVTGTQTDYDGNYIIANMAPGTYDLKATYVGFSPQQINGVVLIKGKETRLDIALSQGIILDAVVIVEYCTPLIDVDNTTSGGTLTSEDIKNLPGKNIHALADLTRGLTTEKSKKGKKVSGRGSRSARTEYYLDGVRVKGGKTAKIEAESTRVARSSKIVDQSLAHKLTATEVNDFSDWNFWSDIQETDFIHTSLEWKMNPQHRFSIQLKNYDGFIASGLRVDLMDGDENILWSAVSDNLGKAELFANFLENKTQQVPAHVRVHTSKNYSVDFSAEEFRGNTQIISIDHECASSDVLEIAFLLDVSGSMRDEMNYLKSEIIDIVDQLTKKNKNQTIRVGLVTYQGHRDEIPIKYQPLTENISQIIASIGSNCHGGHHDEAMDEALRVSVDELNWSTNSHKIAFVIGDQQVFRTDNYRSVLRENVKRSAAAGIKLVPIGCSGMPKALEYVMRTMAIATGGTYLALTDDSGIGGRHTMPTTNSIDVKSLNRIIIDVIARFTSSSACHENKKGITMDVDENAIHQNLNKKYAKENLELKIKLFPNPTNGVFSVKNKDQKIIKAAFICDLAGRIVKTMDVTDKQFDISGLAAGQYFFLYKNELGSFGTETIIKMSSNAGLARK